MSRRFDIPAGVQRPDCESECAVRITAHPGVVIEVMTYDMSLENVIPLLAKAFALKVQCIAGWSDSTFLADIEKSWASVEQVHEANIAIAAALETASRTHYGGRP